MFGPNECSTSEHTASPTALSPFSNSSAVPSEPTSEDVPDLGAFGTVFRALNRFSLAPPSSFVSTSANASTTITASASSDGEYPDPSVPAAWSHGHPHHSHRRHHHQDRRFFPAPSSSQQPDFDYELDDEIVFHHSARGNDYDNDQNEDQDEDDEDTQWVLEEEDEGEEPEDETQEEDTYEEGYASGSPARRPIVDLSGDDLDMDGGDDSSDIVKFPPPSLGAALNEALSFIAAERVRWQTTTLDNDNNNNHHNNVRNDNSEEPTRNRNTFEPRRKRRRKRKSLTIVNRGGRKVENGPTTAPMSAMGTSLSPSDESSLHGRYHHQYQSTPATPPKNQKRLLSHSKSVPTLRPASQRRRLPSVSTSTVDTTSSDEDGSEPALRGTNSTTPQRNASPPPTAQQKQMRSLARKLRKEFPEDTASIDAVMLKERHSEAEFDTRGPDPAEKDALIHVFVDHSNILIGLLTHLKRHGYKYKPKPVRPLPTPAQKQRATDTNSTNNGQTITNTATTKHPLPKPPMKPKHLCHAALALILERGRPITRRSLVTSSPLYQPIESAIKLGYDVKVYARVPDLGDGADRLAFANGSGKTDGLRHSFSGASGSAKTTPKLKRGGSAKRPQRAQHVRNVSATSVTSLESTSGSGENGVGTGVFSESFIKSLKSSPQVSRSVINEGAATTNFTINNGGFNNTTITNNSNVYNNITSYGSNMTSSKYYNTAPNTPGIISMATTTTQISAPDTPTASAPPPPLPATAPASPRTTRIKYREQGVDELIQLKLHQALAATDVPPPGATIVLATGDGNVGQFSDEGFLGPVRTALRRGWDVELYAWEDGLSRAWRKEFGDGIGKVGEEGEGRFKGRFRIVGMEKFWEELLVV